MKTSKKPARTGSKPIRATSTKTKKLVVAPKADGWAVKREGSSRTRVFNTQADAIKAATKTARDSQSEVVIHRKDGRIQEKVSISRADSMMLDVWKSTHREKSHSKRH